MKKIKKIIALLIRIVLFIWQLPQNILGLVSLAWHFDMRLVERKGNIWIFTAPYVLRGVILGQIIILPTLRASQKSERHFAYSYSRYLSLTCGPIYLLVVGIPAVVCALKAKKSRAEEIAEVKAVKYSKSDWLLKVLTYLGKEE